MNTLHQVTHCSQLIREASELLDRLDAFENTPGGTLQRAFDRLRRRQKRWDAAADAQWGPLTEGVAA